MQAEKRNFSWAHWNMYNNEATSKGMGPWAWNYAQNPSTRTFDADPLEALVGFYRFKDGSRGGGVYNSQLYPDGSGNVYVDFPETTGVGVWARINSIYVPKNDVYNVIIRYSSELSRKLRLVYTDESGVSVNQEVLFPSTISYGVWNSLEIPINLPAGEGALKIVAVDEKGVALDWMWLTL